MNESGFKQRLIGAAVLIALAVLFLPIILDGRKAQYFEQDLIPDRPADSVFPELAASLEENSNTQQASSSSDSENPSAKANKTIKTKPLTGQETALIVQVASFADETNAKKLVERLKSQNLKAYVGLKKVKRDGKSLNRVLIGPMLLKSEADAVLEKLKDNSDLKATIVEYDPVKY